MFSVASAACHATPHATGVFMSHTLSGQGKGVSGICWSPSQSAKSSACATKPKSYILFVSGRIQVEGNSMGRETGEGRWEGSREGEGEGLGEEGDILFGGDTGWEGLEKVHANLWQGSGLGLAGAQPGDRSHTGTHISSFNKVRDTACHASAQASLGLVTVSVKCRARKARSDTQRHATFSSSFCRHAHKCLFLSPVQSRKAQHNIKARCKGMHGHNTERSCH